MIRVLSDRYWSIWPITFTTCSIFWIPFLNLSILSALESSPTLIIEENVIGDPILGGVLLKGIEFSRNVGTFNDGTRSFGTGIFGICIPGLKLLGGAMDIGACVSLSPDWSFGSMRMNFPSLIAFGKALFIRSQNELTSKREFVLYSDDRYESTWNCKLMYSIVIACKYVNNSIIWGNMRFVCWLLSRIFEKNSILEV